MAPTFKAEREAFVAAWTGDDPADAERILGELEDAAYSALAAGELEGLLPVRAKVSRARRVALAAAPESRDLARLETLDRALGAAITGIQLAFARAQQLPIPDTIETALREPARPTVRDRVLAALDETPRRPVDLAARAGVGKRQLHRALTELIARGSALPTEGDAADERAVFYRRAS